MAAKQTKNQSIKQKSITPEAKDPEVIENNALLPVNPLLQSPVITPGQETEQKVQIITEIESLAEITKQQLSMRRQRVELEVENKKLDAAKGTIDSVS